MENLEDMQMLYAADKMLELENIKIALSPLVDDLQKLEAQKLDLELQIKNLNKSIASTTSRIRELWFPLIAGAGNAELNLNDATIKMETTLNISVDERDLALDYLMSNGYQGVMKWDLNTQTLKAIARQLMKEDKAIPGLKYTEFQKITIK